MKKQYAVLQRISNNETITERSHYRFLYLLQHALLHSLLENGTLTPMQLRHAEETLRKQREERARNKQEEP